MLEQEQGDIAHSLVCLMLLSDFPEYRARDSQADLGAASDPLLGLESMRDDKAPDLQLGRLLLLCIIDGRIDRRRPDLRLIGELDGPSHTLATIHHAPLLAFPVPRPFVCPAADQVEVPMIRLDPGIAKRFSPLEEGLERGLGVVSQCRQLGRGEASGRKWEGIAAHLVRIERGSGLCTTFSLSQRRCSLS